MSIFTLFFVVAAGLVAAGLVSSVFVAVSGEPLRPGVLGTRDVFMPLRVLALVVGLPMVLGGVGLKVLRDNRHSPLQGWLAIAAAAFWCFVQGVVIVAAVLRLAPAAS